MGTVTKNLYLQGNNTNYLRVEDRPLEIKNAIQSLFSSLSKLPRSIWTLLNGEEKYNMSNLDEHKLIRKMEENNPDQNSFNIIDIGAGDYSWIESLAKFFNDKSEAFTNKSFNVFGLNGEGSPEIIVIGNVKLHYYGGFRSEDLSSEFNAKGHMLENNVDLIVSRFSLRHMIDPIGTMLQAYDLLKPNTGLILTDDFSIKYTNLDGSLLYENKPGKFEGHLKQFHIYSHLDANVLMCPSTAGARSFYHFNIQKLTPDIAKVPITYSGLVFHKGRRNVCEYKTEFSSLIQTKEMEVFSPCTGAYLSAGCLGDKELYDWFENNDLFSSDRYTYCGDITSSGDISNSTNHYDLK